MLNKPTGEMLDAGGAVNPQPAGTPTPGTSTAYARADHVHAVPIVALVGDVTGNSDGNTVGKLLGRDLSAQPPSSGQALLWSGTAWTPGTVSGGGGGSGGGQIYYLDQATTAANQPNGNTTTKRLSRTNPVAQTLLDFTLTNGSYTVASSFITDLSDPNTSLIPSGLWDIALFAYSTADVNHPTSVRIKAYKYSGTTLTLLGTSQVELMTNYGTYVQRTFTISFQDTTLLPADRIYLEIESSASASGHHLMVAFGDGTPSHAHTTLPDVAVSGTGLYKLLNGVPQSPATLLVDSDVSASAAIAVSKISGAVTTTQLAGYVATSQLGVTGGVAQLDSTGKLTNNQIPALTTGQIAQITPAGIGAVATSDTIPIIHGGTGETTRQAALNTIAGSQATGQFLRGDGTNVSMSAIQATDLPTVPVNKGGTGQTSFSDGDLLIGNSSGNTLTKAQLVAGANITITPGAGTITIASSGSGAGTVTTSAPVTTGALSKFASALAITNAVAGTDYVTPSGNITGTAGNVTGTVAIANGGTGATSGPAALTALGAVPSADLVLTKTANKVPKLTGDGLLSILQIPPATTTNIGGVVVGSGLAVDPSGVLSVSGSGVPGIVVTQRTGNGTNTSFLINGYTSTDANAYSVAVEGIDQRPTTDYTISAANGGTITFAAAPAADAPIVVRAYIVGSGGGGGADIGGRAWSAAATYTEGDLVATSQTETWICIQDANTNHNPETSPSWWAPAPASAVQLQFRPIAATAPTAGQVLGWSATNSRWEPMTIGNAGGSVTFDTVGVHNWVAPMFARYVRIQGVTGDGTGGTGGQGENGADGVIGILGEDPTHGAQGDDVDGTPGTDGKDVKFNLLTFAGGDGGGANTGYGGGGGGSVLEDPNNPGYYTACDGVNGSGTQGGYAGRGQSGGEGGCGGGGQGALDRGGFGYEGGGDGGQGGQLQLGTASGMGGGGGCFGSGGGGGSGAYSNGFGTVAYGLGGKGGKGANTNGAPGETFDQYTLVTGGELYEVEITEGAGSASITISW